MYLIIWEFRVKAGREADFEVVYGPEGAWVDLFRRGEGYLGTELLRDEATPGRYFTFDRWISTAAYEGFRERWVEAYQALDRQGEGLTEHEVLVGKLVIVG